jgi:hypothetical protein
MVMVDVPFLPVGRYFISPLAGCSFFKALKTAGLSVNTDCLLVQVVG